MGQGKRQIAPVRDNYDKQLTFKRNIEQYNRAMKQEFYFEAILIDYACLEDRMCAILYHLGVLESDKDFKARKNAHAAAFREIVRARDGKGSLGMNGLGAKQGIVERVLLAVQSGAELPGNAVLPVLQKKLNDAKRCADVLDLLDAIRSWCAYRNEIIHALMNKNIDSLHGELGEKSDAGFKLFRALDSHVKWFEKRGIRKALGLPE